MNPLRANIRALHLAKRNEHIEAIANSARLSPQDRSEIVAAALKTVQQLRAHASPSLIESFLAEYRLSSREGVALMCLAEALPRIPDSDTAGVFILDKIIPSNWSRHLNRSSSVLVNASTWALMLSGKLLSEDEQDTNEDLLATLQGLARRLGESVMQAAVVRAVGALGDQFVLAETIEDALRRATEMEARGYLYSYDMLGEAAYTQAEADAYHLAYSNAITALASQSHGDSLHERPGISVKLSALHPRYCFAQRERVLEELTARCLSLALLAKSANLGFNLDAEESERLDLSLDVIEAVLSESSLTGWDGFGVAVQAYAQRSPAVLDWLHDLARRLDRRILVRLVKGAYWDREIKRAQTLGIDGFPVFTHKCDTDLAYIACARKLLDMRERIYPQFATHNAHSIHAILHMAGDVQGYELQRLHGMGMALHETIRETHGNACRIYAPVGSHRHLLSYLARRLLENGANNSFVHRLVDERIAPEDIVRDPFDTALDPDKPELHPAIALPRDLFGANRINSQGRDWDDPAAMQQLDVARQKHHAKQWHCSPMLAGKQEFLADDNARAICNPALPEKVVGHVQATSLDQLEQAVTIATQTSRDWQKRSMNERAALLEAVADLYQAHAPELFELLIREGGKTLPDAVGEVREAVDFLRYYAQQARSLPSTTTPCGLFACISPWNFPLAIFTGQIAAALVVGNMVLAKPSERAPLIAARAVSLLHQAGIPGTALQLLPDHSGDIGAALVTDPRIDGVCFTGSTTTAQHIHRAMAKYLQPHAPLIAETGGINAMIVDSTALIEQATNDILTSAFQSAGQRCSALRILYVQQECQDEILKSLFGAMDELRIGNPAQLVTDIGPVIDAKAQNEILTYLDDAEQQGRCLKRCSVPDNGCFVPPSVLRVSGIREVKREVFGPILHVANFASEDIDAVIADINAHGYGLTFGLHSRIDKQVQHLVDALRVGNFYVNRNQIGAVVGSQPFGGEQLSGTGPKAGGPNYLRRFCASTERTSARRSVEAPVMEAEQVQAALHQLAKLEWKKNTKRSAVLARILKVSGFSLSLPNLNAEPLDLPGPTGESNRLLYAPRGIVLCLGFEEKQVFAQMLAALSVGGRALVITPQSDKAQSCFYGIDAPLMFLQGVLSADALELLQDFDVVACCGETEDLRPYAQALAAREGPILQLVTDAADLHRFLHERHLCIDTTAAGGNASLLAATDGAL